MDFNQPRNMAIFLTRNLGRDGLREISGRFRMEKYSSIISIIERMKKWMMKDQGLTMCMDRVAERINKSQEQT